jgi:DNA-binding response OmpR family regulator
MPQHLPLVIFIIEDNDALRLALIDALESNGHLCVGMASAEDVDDAALLESPDLFLIDLNLPGEDGLSLTRRIRQSQPNAGIVLLTALTHIDNRLSGYEAGADLYLAKPIHPTELNAIVGAMANRLKNKQKPYSQGIKVMADDLLLVGETGVQATLTSSELKLLGALARAPGQTLQSWQVATHLGQSDSLPSKASVEVRLSRIRKKLNDVGAPPTSIKAIKGYGYKLNVTVSVY